MSLFEFVARAGRERGFRAFRPGCPVPGRFAQDDRGGITIFVLILMILLLVAGGMAVDYQRYELARADLQDALDRGVLAATNTNQSYDPNGSLTLDEQAEALIGEYMAVRNYRPGGFQINASMTEMGGGRSIVASATEPMETIFLRLMGITTMDVTVNSGAIQAIPRLEIALILDVSGSMGWNSTSSPGTKIDQLRVAAKDFIDTILSADNAAQTLISIIPFSEQVALPRAMADLYNLNRHHDFSSCFDYRDLDFDTTAMPLNPGTAYRQGQHFIESGSGASRRYACPLLRNAITPLSNDASVLKAAIDALGTESWTATYMGMKWGTALLDPSSRQVVDAMIAAGDLAPEFAGWPHDWTDPGVRKITVMMTDGQNTKLNMIRESAYAQHTPSYWDTNPPRSGERITLIDNEVDGVGDVMMKRICDQSKLGPNSTVYTIGFELAGQPLAEASLSDCASSPATFYLVNGVEISTAFANIADEIVNLKLTN